MVQLYKFRNMSNSRVVNSSADNRLLFLQMNVPLYGVLGAAVTLLVYILGIGTIVKLFICLLALILG